MALNGRLGEDLVGFLSYIINSAKGGHSKDILWSNFFVAIVSTLARARARAMKHCSALCGYVDD